LFPAHWDESRSAERTADNLWEFTQRSYNILSDHPVNKERNEEGLYSANAIITRGAGLERLMPTLKDLYGIRAACVAGDATVGGIAELAGMDYFTDESFTGSFDTNLTGKALLTLRLINEQNLRLGSHACQSNRPGGT